MADELTSRVEYAKSGRAECKGCRSLISQGSLRVGRQYSADHSGHLFYHPKCFKWYPSCPPEDFFFGWADLEASDQQALRKYCKVKEDTLHKEKDQALSSRAEGEPEGGYDSLKVTELKAIAKARGLPVGKPKAELIRLLRQDDESFQGSSSSSSSSSSSNQADSNDAQKKSSSSQKSKTSSFKAPEVLPSTSQEDSSSSSGSVHISACILSIAGTLATTQKVAKTKIESLGGQLKSSVDSSVTHLITIPQELAKKSPKIQAALKACIPIVSESFLDDLLDGLHCDPKDYPVESPSTAATKRSSSESNIPESKAPTKQAKTVKKKPAPVVESSSSDDEEDDDDEDDSESDSELVDDQPTTAFGEQLPLTSDGYFDIHGSAPAAKNYKFGGPGEPAYNNTNYNILVHRVLQVTDLHDNHNKYYSMELHKGQGPYAYRLFTHYGRTDDLTTRPGSGQKECKYFGNLDSAKLFWNKLMRDKTSGRKGYQPVSLASSNIGSPLARGRSAGRVGDQTRARASGASAPSSSSSSSSTPSSSSSSSGAESSPVPKATSLHPAVQSLINYIYDETSTAVTSSIDARITAKGLETPLGVLTIEQIARGEAVLDNILAELSKPKPNPNTLKSLTGQYFTVIPHRIGRSVVSVRESTIDRMEKYTAEMDLIQLMKDMLQVDLHESEEGKSHENVFHTNDVEMRYQALGTKLTPLDHDSKEFKDLLLYFKKTESAGLGAWAHKKLKPEDIPQPNGKLRVNIKNIYEVYHEQSRKNYDNSVGNEHLLYHGSRLCNFVGLLSRGLLMPDAVTAMGIPRTDFGWLGAGIYFGDCFQTASQYCTSTGKSKGNNSRLMMVCRVSLGKWGEQLKRDGKIRNPHPGCDSLHGNPHLPNTQFDDDEFAIYNQSQQHSAYLIEFTH